MYGNEEAVGAGLKASGTSRDEVFVTTKVWYEDLAPADLRRSAEASLKPLGLSQVDLLLIHWPNARIPLAGTVRALCDAKRAGLARHVGVANFTVRLLDEAVAAADEPIAANQCEYHPYLDQRAVLSACRRHGVAFISYCPLGKAQVLGEPVSRRSPRRTAARRRKSCCAGICSRASRRSRNPETPAASPRISPCSTSRSPRTRWRAARSRPTRRAHGGAILVAGLGLIPPRAAGEDQSALIRGAAPP